MKSMQIKIILKILYFIIFLFSTIGLLAAPLGSDYPDAQGATPLEARLLVIESALRYIGTPYLHAGLTLQGLDCSGFIFVSFHDALGVSVPRTSIRLHSWVEEIPQEELQPGDLVFFKTNFSQTVNHVGLYVGNRRFLHAASAGLKPELFYRILTKDTIQNSLLVLGAFYRKLYLSR